MVLDDGAVGGGETGRTTAHLSNALDDRYYVLERLHGEEGARLAAESHAAAIDRIEPIVAEEGIDCDFERLDGYLFVPPGESLEILDAELEAARRAGLRRRAWCRARPLTPSTPGRACASPARPSSTPSLPGRGSPGPSSGAAAGSSAAPTSTGRGRPAGRVSTEGGRTVTADVVVCATNTPVNDRLVIHTKQAPYRTYVIAARVPRGTVPRALYWDTADPYHYVRLGGAGDAADRRRRGPQDRPGGRRRRALRALEAWTRERFPVGEVEYRWSGQVMEPVDGLAYHRPQPAATRATSSSPPATPGHGMTHGTIAGMLLTDLILGRPNPWETLYDPSRKSLKSAAEFAEGEPERGGAVPRLRHTGRGGLRGRDPARGTGRWSARG